MLLPVNCLIEYDSIDVFFKVQHKTITITICSIFQFFKIKNLNVLLFLYDTFIISIRWYNKIWIYWNTKWDYQLNKK